MVITGKHKYLLLKTVQEKNILPLTSVCDLNCLFCSHHQNPPDIETYQFGHLDKSLVKELINYLPRQGPVTIGESASKINEGEPLLYPHFKEVMRTLRSKFPDKEIRLTTSGSLLDQKLVFFLKEQKPLTINLSLNCASPQKRKEIMNDPRPEAVFRALSYLKKENISYNGSIVLTEKNYLETLERSAAILSTHGARTIRVFVPGITRYYSGELKPMKQKDEKKLNAEVLNLQKKYKLPIIKEPPYLKDFQARIQGVVPDSPAGKAGLQTGDIIADVGDKNLLTRIDKFKVLKKAENPVLKITKKNKETKKVKINKKSGVRPGLILHSDISSLLINRIQQLVNKYKPAKIALITSVLAEGMMDKLVKMVHKEIPRAQECLQLLVVENHYFGGNIKAAGLLTTGDILKKLKERKALKPDILLVPQKIYGFSGTDLRDESYQKLEDRGLQVELL